MRDVGRSGPFAHVRLALSEKRWGPQVSFPLALHYFNIPVMTAHKDPNPENGLLSLEAPL